LIARAGLIAAALAVAEVAAAATLPQWARELVAASQPATGHAVVLLDHIEVEIRTDGTLRTSRRYAALIVDRAGRDAASIRGVYVPGSGSIKTLRGWVASRGKVRAVGDDAVVDAALVNNDVFNEVRVRAMSAGDEVTPGDVFAAELESEERLLFAQLEWQMQQAWPTRTLRRTLVIPPGWRATSVMFNAPPLEPRRVGNSLVWERDGVAALPDEPAMPPHTDIAPRLAVSVFAKPPGRAPGEFESWQSVAQWLHGVSDGASAATAAVVSTARRLTQGATTDFERAAAIARYAQTVQYISIQTGIGRGGGYQPRPAALVLERNYGDCKDKVALMRAMLSAVGISSYLVSLYSGDRGYVRAEWPSPQQFNHAIIAIHLRQPINSGVSAIDHPGLGRLVVFDPTDQHTPFGELPIDAQDSLALTVHPQTTSLVRLPTTAAARHVTERTVKGSIAANGTLSGSVHERHTGAAASSARALRNAVDADSYRELLTRRVAATVPRVNLANITAAAGPSPDHDVSFDIVAPAFTRQAGGLLLMPMPFDNGVDGPIPSAAERKTAVLLDPHVVNETVELRLPPGFAVDAVSPPVTFESPFGRYSLEYTVTGGVLIAKRRLEVPSQRIEPAALPAARVFFDRVRRADTDLIVLTRK
jgi:hypothetical protein